MVPGDDADDGILSLQVKRKGDDADDVGSQRGIGPLQVKRKSDDADDVGPLPGDWSPAGEAQGR